MQDKVPTPEETAQRLQQLGTQSPDLPPALEKEKEDAATTNKMFDYADIIHGHIRQEVQVAKQTTAIYQTLNGKEDLWLRKRTGDFAGESVDYVAAWYRNAELALGMVDLTLSGQRIDLPAVQYTGDDPDESSVEARMEALLSRVPNVLLNKLQMHYSWFLERISEEFSGGALKNGLTPPVDGGS